jgi:hypothetical protein
MLTCIINQFDFKAGTSGAAFCIPSGNESVANPTINIANGLIIAPNKVKEVTDSSIKAIKVIPQVKNNKDSYKLLNGKYPLSNPSPS